MKDLIISCIQCGRSFTFTVKEQERTLARGFSNPKRCPECRNKKDRTLEPKNGGQDKSRKKPHQRKPEADFEED